MLTHTVIFVVITLIYAAANTVQRGIYCLDSQIFNQPDPLRVKEISNRVRRNAFDIPDISEITDNTASKIRRNVFQNVISALPNKDKIKDLLTIPRIKRSFYDYDSSDDRENIDPKTQLKQIASRNIAPNAGNEDQQRKIFLSRIYSVIDNDKNSSNTKINYNEKDFSEAADVSFVNGRYNYDDSLNDDTDQSSEFLKSDGKETFSEKSQTHETGKYNNLNEFDLQKNIYVPIRSIKERRVPQDDPFSPIGMNVKINSRPERQLSDPINSDRSDKQINEHSNLKDLVWGKNPNVPMRKLKKRQEVEVDPFPPKDENTQDDSFPENNMNAKINSRLERQLGELINDDGTDKKFYKYSEIDSGANEEYEDREPPMDQQLPYGPTEDDEVQNSSANIFYTTTDINISSHESNEEIDDVSNSVSLVSSPSTSIPPSSISFTTPTEYDITEKHRKISSNYNLNSPESIQKTTNNVLSFKINTTEQTPTTSSSYTSHEDIVRNRNNVKSFDSYGKVNNKTNQVNVPNDNTAVHYKSAKLLYEGQSDSEKISSRRTNSNSGKENFEPKQKLVDSSKAKNDGASLISDIKGARVYNEAEVTTNKNDVLENPLAARIKLDFLIQLQTPGNDEFRIYRVS